LLSLFDVHFTVSGVLAINNGMMPQYNAHHSSHLTNMPYQHNTKGFLQYLWMQRLLPIWHTSTQWQLQERYFCHIYFATGSRHRT